MHKMSAKNLNTQDVMYGQIFVERSRLTLITEFKRNNVVCNIVGSIRELKLETRVFCS